MSYLFSKVNWPSCKYVLQSGYSGLFVKPLQFNVIGGYVPVLAKLSYLETISTTDGIFDPWLKGYTKIDKYAMVSKTLLRTSYFI